MIRNSERKKVIHCNLMSVFLAAAYNPKAAVVFHAPKSCSHIAYNAFWEMRRKIENQKNLKTEHDCSNLFVTGLADKEAIFGGEKILKECLLDVVAEQKPEYIIVAAGCAAGVIGDDVAAICQEAEQTTGVPVLYVEGSGFMNQKAVDGVLSITKAICQRFVYPLLKKTKDPASIAVVGMNSIFSPTKESQEINRLLGLFGFTKIYYPPGGMSLEQFKDMASVSAITAISFLPKTLVEVEKFAQQFAEKREIDYIKLKIPNTMDAVYEWLQTIGTVLNRTTEAEKLEELEKQSYNKFLQQITTHISNKNYIFAISLPQRYFDPLEIIKMLDEAGMQLQGIVFCEELTKQEQQAHYESLKEKVQTEFYSEAELQKLMADILLTTTPKKCLLPQYCITFRRIGRSGVENFLLKLAETLNDKRKLVYEK